eukprot:scaffold1820_cov129-Cylindrotheca_fusiformis.AAC.5
MKVERTSIASSIVPAMTLPVANTSRKENMKRKPEQVMIANTSPSGGRCSARVSVGTASFAFNTDSVSWMRGFVAAFAFEAVFLFDELPILHQGTCSYLQHCF